MAFRILRKKDLAKKQKLALHHNLMRGRSIILGWSLMQLAALEQPLDLNISLDSKPVWLKKNVELVGIQPRDCYTSYFWNIALLSTLLFGVSLKPELYKNLRFLGKPRRGNFQTTHSNISRALYFSWLSIYLRSSFFNKRGRRLSTVILTNTLFYDSLIPLTYQKFYFFNDLETPWLGSFLPTPPLNLPFSTRNLYDVLYPFFFVGVPFFLKFNHYVTRYFWGWRQSVLYPDERVAVLATSYSFFSAPASRVNLVCKSCGSLVIAEQLKLNCLKAFELADTEFTGLVNEVEDELEAVALIGGEYSVERFAGADGNAVLGDIPYRAHLWAFKYDWDFRWPSIFLEYLYGTVKILKLDVGSQLKGGGVGAAMGAVLTKNLCVKFSYLNMKDFNYNNVVNPFWLFLTLVQRCLLTPLRFFSFYRFRYYMFLDRFKWKIGLLVRLASYLFYIKIKLVSFLSKKLLKSGIILDLLFYVCGYTYYLGICIFALLFRFYFFKQLFAAINSRLIAFNLIIFFLMAGLICFGLSTLKFFFLIVFAESVFAFFRRQFAFSLSLAGSRSLDELFGLFRASSHVYRRCLNTGLTSLMAFIWYNLLSIGSFLIGIWRKVGAWLDTVSLERGRLDSTYWGGVIILGLFRYKPNLTLMQLFFLTLGKRWAIALGQTSFNQNFFDTLYLLFLFNPAAIFWFYFSFFLNVFGGFGWWLNATLTVLPNHFLVRAIYFSKLLQRSTTPGYYASGWSLLSRIRVVVNILATEVLFIYNCFNPQFYAVLLSRMVASLAFGKLTWLRINQTFADILGERFLGLVFTDKYLTFRFTCLGFSFFYQKTLAIPHRRWVPLLMLSTPLLYILKLFFFCCKVFRLLVCFFFATCALISAVLIITKLVLLFWVAVGYVVLKFFWLCTLASGFMIFFKRYFF